MDNNKSNLEKQLELFAKSKNYPFNALKYYIQTNNRAMGEWLPIADPELIITLGWMNKDGESGDREVSLKDATDAEKIFFFQRHIDEVFDNIKSEVI